VAEPEPEPVGDADAEEEPPEGEPVAEALEAEPELVILLAVVTNEGVEVIMDESEVAGGIDSALED
jgi:hypothetical protein